MEPKCSFCGNSFKAINKQQKYCSKECRIKAKTKGSPQINKYCKNCGNPFKTRRKKQIFCSAVCRISNSDKERAAAIPQWQKNISSSLVGMASEFAVMIDLIKRGYEPCRPIRSNAPFDILLHTDGKAVRVEVRTAHNINGRIITSERGEYDVLAIVIHEEDRIIYKPDVLK